jgi:hypothetical protein
LPNCVLGNMMSRHEPYWLTSKYPYQITHPVTAWSRQNDMAAKSENFPDRTQET